jgi:hypothetical protein
MDADRPGDEQDEQDDQEEEKMIRTELMNISTKKPDEVACFIIEIGFSPKISCF